MKLLILVVMFVLFQGLCLAQEKELESPQSSFACSFQLTESGRQSSFRFSFAYRLEVGADGKVTKIEEMDSTKRYKKYKFVQEELFIDCMQNWQFETESKYFVSFHVGTTSHELSNVKPRNFIQIITPRKRELIIEILPSKKK